MSWIIWVLLYIIIAAAAVYLLSVFACDAVGADNPDLYEYTGAAALFGVMWPLAPIYVAILAAYRTNKKK